MIKCLISIFAFWLLTTTAFGADGKQLLRIALIADTHTTRGTAEDQPLYKAHLDHVIAAVNSANVDLVLVAGDLTQGGKPEEMADFQAQVKGFQAPVWYVFGNHDVGGKHIPGQAGGVTADRVSLAERTLGPSFWSRRIGGVRVIGINASLLGSGLPHEADQWAFLTDQMRARFQGPTLVVMHYPLFVQTPDEPGGLYWNVEPQPRARLRSLLHTGGVCAVLTGHLHRELIAQDQGLLLYTTPPVSFGLPRGRQPEGWSLVTVAPDGQITADFHPTDAPTPELASKE